VVVVMDEMVGVLIQARDPSLPVDIVTSDGGGS